MLVKKLNFLKKVNSIKLLYWLSFLIPFLSLFLYFAWQNCNLLTVDLGQQYIDLLAFLRQNLFKDPLKLVYSFQNGLGNSMIATNAYYLLSPANLILFFLPQNTLPLAVLIVISTKFGLCGLSSFYYWQTRFNRVNSLAASCAYALSGFMVANYFNLMWLDSVILLPLLIKAIDQLLAQQKNRLLLITFLIWITNFYTGYMALLFGFCYFLSQFFQKKCSLYILGSYLKLSILASFLASFILLPVFFEMLNGKASQSNPWSLNFQFPLIDELTKLVDASYSFHEMESGLPNVFLTQPFLLLAVLYFLTNKNWHAKLASGLLLIFLVLSLSFTPLVLFWHLGQFPIWYPGRFSFVLIFYCLTLGLQALKTPHFTSSNKIIISLLALGLVIFWYLKKKDITYLNENNLVISTLFVILALLFINFIFKQHAQASYFLLGIVVLEAIINLVLSLDNLSFQNNQDYQNFARTTLKASNRLPQDYLYRTEKSFYRSDDDPLTANYNGVSSFNSVTNQRSMQLLASLGYLHNSNSVANQGSTPLSDAILGVKYYLVPNYSNPQRLTFNNPNHRLDLGSNQYQKQEDIQILKMPALPLIFTSAFNGKVKLDPDQPLVNQEQILTNVLATKDKLVKMLPLPPAHLKGVKKESADLYLKQKIASKNTISYYLNLKSVNSYYLQLPSGLDDQVASLTINNNQIDLATRDSQSHLINIAYRQQGQKLILIFTLLQNQLDLSQVKLAQISLATLKQQLTRFNRQQPQTKMINPLFLSTNQFKTHRPFVLTTIPYSNNWLIFDKGQLVKKESWLNSLIKVKLKHAAVHQLTLIYVPFIFLIGILLSLITLALVKFVFRLDD